MLIQIMFNTHGEDLDNGTDDFNEFEIELDHVPPVGAELHLPAPHRNYIVETVQWIMEPHPVVEGRLISEVWVWVRRDGPITDMQAYKRNRRQLEEERRDRYFDDGPPAPKKKRKK